MGNEYWILYSDMEWKRWGSKWNEPLPTTAKDGLHLKNVMLCIWWDWRGIRYYEFLLENQIINSNKYCSQIDQLKATLDKKLPELVNRKHIILHQDKSRLHDSLMTRQKLLQFVLIHLLYSPNIAPSDVYLCPFILVFIKFS